MNIKKHGFVPKTSSRARCFLNFPLGNRKKAAIELSVTAIVILILAIVILGLGLGFIRGMFGKAATLFEQQIAAEPEPPAPSGSEPITLSRESVVTHAKDSEVLKIALYNPSNADWTYATPSIKCSVGFGSVDMVVNNKTVTQGESKSYNVLMNMPSDVDAGAYLCYAFISAANASGDLVNVSGYTKDFIVKIIK